MNILEYARMAERERTYWWHTGRLAIIDVWLKNWVKPPTQARILNVGCGTGGTLPILEKYGKVDNIDVSPEAIKFMKNAGYKVTKVKDHHLDFKDGTYDLVVAFDVLEHIKNHEGALKEWGRVLKKDGSILLTIPAYQWLWSGHDESLHHHRRYTARRLKGILPTNLKKARISYAIVFSLPLVVGFRWMHKLSGRKTSSETSYVNLPKSINNFFANLLKLEAQAHKATRLPFGTSLIAWIKKD